MIREDAFILPLNEQYRVGVGGQSDTDLVDWGVLIGTSADSEWDLCGTCLTLDVISVFASLLVRLFCSEVSEIPWNFRFARGLRRGIRSLGLSYGLFSFAYQ